MKADSRQNAQESDVSAGVDPSRNGYSATILRSAGVSAPRSSSEERISPAEIRSLRWYYREGGSCISAIYPETSRQCAAHSELSVDAESRPTHSTDIPWGDGAAWLGVVPLVAALKYRSARRFSLRRK